MKTKFLLLAFLVLSANGLILIQVNTIVWLLHESIILCLFLIHYYVTKHTTKQIDNIRKINLLHSFVHLLRKQYKKRDNHVCQMEVICEKAMEIGAFEKVWIGDPAQCITAFEQYYITDRLITLPIQTSIPTIMYVNLYAYDDKFYTPQAISALLGLANTIAEILDHTAKTDETKNEKRFQALIEKSTDMLMLTSADGKIIYGSSAITNTLGYSIAEFKNKSAIEYIHPEGHESFINNRIDLANTTDSAVYFEHRVRHKNGHWIWCEGTGKNMLHEPGVEAIVSSFRDISEKKAAEMERAKMVSDMVRRNTELETFAFIVSHNLRAPVANIIGACNLIKSDELDIADKDTLNEGINRSAIKIDEVIQDLNNILQQKNEVNAT